MNLSKLCAIASLVSVISHGGLFLKKLKNDIDFLFIISQNWVSTTVLE